MLTVHNLTICDHRDGSSELNLVETCPLQSLPCYMAHLTHTVKKCNANVNIFPLSKNDAVVADEDKKVF
jgi:hypothetical protein